MIEPKPSTIEEAPSLAAITSAADRVGKVDFTATLSGAAYADTAEHHSDVVALTSMARPMRPAGDDDDGPRMPFILPPAKIDAAMAAEAERTRQEVAAARGEPGAGPEPDDLEDAVGAVGDEDASGEEPAPDDHVETATTPPSLPESLLIHGVADLEQVAAQAGPAPGLVAAEEPDPEPEPEPIATVRELTTLTEPTEVTATTRRRSAEVDAPLRSVAEVAASVIAAMRAMNEVHERHVESIELETARRCELLTAQAELDAELIRLHARREAHAIISAARIRSGDHDAGQVETDQLGEIGETFSRFAETIETTVTSGPPSPDYLRVP